MKQGQFTKLFYMVHSSGDKLYPVSIKGRDTGNIAFKVSPGGNRGNTNGKSIEILDENEMKTYVFEHEYAVRASTLNGSRKGLYKINQKSIIRAVELA